jgi:predicted nuclease with TOPRIM domain
MLEELRQQLKRLEGTAMQLKESQEKAKIAYWQTVGRIAQLEDIIELLKQETAKSTAGNQGEDKK